MSSKVANLIAVELGVLIALMAWLSFSNLRSVQSPAIAQEPTRLVDSFATVAPVRKTRIRPPAPVDYRSELAPATPLEEEPLQPGPEYEQALANEPYDDGGVNAGYITATSPSYAVVGEQPLLASDCFYPPVNQFRYYPQSTAFVVVSNSRTFNRRPRSPHRPQSVRPTMTHRRPPNIQRPRGGGRTVAPRPQTRQQSPRPQPRPRPRQIP